MLLSRALTLRVSYCRPVLYHQSLAATQRVFPALTQTRVNIPPPSATNNQPTIIVRKLYNFTRRGKNMSNSPYVVPDSDESGDDDPMLALAIKLSLQQAEPQRDGGSSSVGKSSSAAGWKRKADLIVISDTESDDQSSRKVARGSKEASAPTRGKKEGSAVNFKSGGGGGGGGMSSIGFDRAQMERERLERLRRKTPSSPSIGVREKSSGDGKEVKPVFYTPAVRTLGGVEFKGGKLNGASEAVIDFQTEGIGRPMGLQFPNGVVKKTWVRGVRRDGTEIKIEEVLGKETLYGAVLSAFQWNHEWVWSKIPNGKLQRFVLVMQAKSEVDKKAILSVLGGLPKTTIVFPPMEKGVNCMHSKLMVLFHRQQETGEEWLRIAVPSANLTDYDWGEGGTMENTVFLIDLPKLPTPGNLDTQFATSFYSFCKAKGIPIDVLERLKSYDYSATKGMAFVHSIGGNHYDENVWKNTGYPGLGTAIKNLGYSSGKDLEVDFLTSSLGATHKDFVINMYNAAMGFDGSGELARRPPGELSHPQNHKNLNKKKAKQFVAKGKGKENEARIKEPIVEVASDTESDVGIECDEETSWERVKKRFRIYFPSRDTVINSKGGIHGAGTICFQGEMWEQEEYPKDILKDCVSVREGILMHNKMLFARPAKQLDTPVGKVDAWAYIGSANFSESAWGKLMMCGGKKKPKIKCKNWECGVIVPVISEPKSGRTLSGKNIGRPARAEPLGTEVFMDVVPVPMDTPGEYIYPDKKPWFHTEIALLARQATKMRKKAEKAEKAGSSKSYM